MRSFFEKTYKGTQQAFYEEVKRCLAADEKKLIVTANPETFMMADRDEQMRSVLMDPDTTIIADGIGVIKGADKLNIRIEERIPGVELVGTLFSYADEMGKSVFLLGARQEVLDLLREKLAREHPGLTVAGAVNGYVEDKDAVFAEMKEKQPDIILVALGMGTQEKLIYKHFGDFAKGIFVGVGGSFDVLSGTKERAPKFFIDHNIEWLYRIAKEPKRFGRFYNNNIKYIFEVRKLAKK